MVVSLGILVSLGSWQLQRLEWKQSLIATIDAKIAAAPIGLDDVLAEMDKGKEVEYQPVEVTGEYLGGAPQKLFGTWDGRPGSFSFVPFRTTNDAVIYINRGFIPQGAAADDIAAVPAGVTTVTGLLRMKEVPAPPASWFQPVGKSPDGLWFIRDPQAMASDAKVDDALDVYVDAFENVDQRWPKGGTTRTDFRNKHREYALTWFGLAGALVAVWFVFSLQPRR